MDQHLWQYKEVGEPGQTVTTAASFTVVLSLSLSHNVRKHLLQVLRRRRCSERSLGHSRTLRTYTLL